jgi:hypothetical protein
MRRHSKRMQAKSRKTQVTPTETPGTYEVLSTSGNTYTTSLNRCTCKWSKYHPSMVCSHRMAVLDYLEAQAGRRVSFWNTEEDATRQHRPVLPVADVWATSRTAA